MNGCGRLPDFIVHSEHFNINMLWNFQYQMHLNDKDNQCGKTREDFLVSFYASRIDTCLNMYDNTEMFKCNSTDYSYMKFKPSTLGPKCTNLDVVYTGKLNDCSSSNNAINLCK